jgi:hypothetical protein
MYVFFYVLFVEYICMQGLGYNAQARLSAGFTLIILGDSIYLSVDI